MPFFTEPGWRGAAFNLNPPGLLSRFLRWARARQARQYLQGRVLDYGCGRGYFCRFVNARNYVGVDVNANILDFARHLNPEYTFRHIEDLSAEERFDSIVCLAVIEHVPDPVALMRTMASHLNPGGKLVVTTPEPVFERVYEWGSALRVFSKHAAEEHESLLGKNQMMSLAESIGLEFVSYRRFLAGANQIAVYQK